MVRLVHFFIFIQVLSFGPLFSIVQEVKVTADIDKAAIADKPFTGVIIITHDKQRSVDLNSFKMENKPIPVKFLKEMPLASDSTVIMSFYEFTMPGKPKGLYLIPEVSVSVGTKKYTSIPSSYEVKETAAQPPTSTKGPAPDLNASPDKLVVLALENIVDGDMTLYPGQQIRLGYRYRYTYSFDLSKEEIPLLEGKGLEKIGGKDVKELTKGNEFVVEITQLFQAAAPGTFKFGPSTIEGRAYMQDAAGQKISDKAIKTSESPAVAISVIPFPEEGKPKSFNGAVGDFNFEASLENNAKVYVGDKIALILKITGSGSVATVPMPEVCCQPGFSGFFRLNDLPPEEKVKDNEKTFRVEMRPLVASIKEIPSIEFSFFNPQSKSYKTIKSKPIPLTVMPTAVKPLPQETKVSNEQQENPEPSVPKVEAIEIEGNYLINSDDLKNKLFGNWWVLLIIPLGVLSLLLQIQMKQYFLQRRKEIKPPTSQELFENAMTIDPTSSKFFNLMQHALLVRLVEKGEIKTTEVPLESLNEHGLSGKVKLFLKKIEMQRFSGKSEISAQQISQEAQNLFKELA